MFRDLQRVTRGRSRNLGKRSSFNALEQDCRVSPRKHGRVCRRLDSLLDPVATHGTHLADEEESAERDEARDAEDNFEQHFGGD